MRWRAWIWAAALLVSSLLAAQARASLAPFADTPSSAPCSGFAFAPGTYGWPVKPFYRAHPVRGNFGDPRTVFWGLEPDAALGGSFNFHNGIDISARDGTAVYPVVSGRVRRAGGEKVIVSAGRRVFQYWHVLPAVVAGERVVADETVLGHILRGRRHVHLTELDNHRVVNPLRHVEPYADHEPPVIRAIEVRGRRRGNLAVQGRIWFIVDAYDEPSLPPPLPWGELPVTPALVQWTMTRAGGRTVVPLTTVADFRRSLPRPSRFWRVYAAGSYQNEPAIGTTFYHLPGRYLFDLTPGGLDTRRLAPARYVVTASAADICGNRTQRSIVFTLRAAPHGAPLAVLGGGVAAGRRG
jgi:hypothetical protein